MIQGLNLVYDAEGQQKQMGLLLWVIWQLVQEPKDKRKGSLSFNSRIWQPCGSKCTFMLQ